MASKKFNGLRGTVSVMLALTILLIPTLAQSQTPQQSSDYVQGYNDGNVAAKGNPLWILGGVICGLFAVVYCYVQSVTPSSVALVGKSQDYVLGYTEGFKKKKGRDAVFAWVGWGIWVVVYVAFVLPNLDTD